MQPHKINDTFKAEVERASIDNSDLPVYLQTSLGGGKFPEWHANKETFCKGWDYLKTHLTKELKECLLNQEYWNLFYLENQKMYLIEHALSKASARLNEDEIKQLKSFAFVWDDKLREAEKIELRANILKQGYTEIKPTQKELDEVKVKGIFSISYDGILGREEKNTEKEGKLVWVERAQCLALMPKGHSKTGIILREAAYIKKI